MLTSGKDNFSQRVPKYHTCAAPRSDTYDSSEDNATQSDGGMARVVALPVKVRLLGEEGAYNNTVYQVKFCQPPFVESDKSMPCSCTRNWSLMLNFQQRNEGAVLARITLFAFSGVSKHFLWVKNSDKVVVAPGCPYTLVNTKFSKEENKEI